MYIQKLPNAAAGKISVTSTATELLDLIETAASTAHGLATSKLNAVDIVVEDGDIRVLFDGNTPTASNGMLLSSGMIYGFRGVPVTKMQLIRVGGSDVACSIQVGQSEKDESSFAAAFDVTLEASSVSIGAISGDTAHDAADSGNPVKIGGKAQDPTSLPSAVSVDDRADLMTDLYSRPVVTLGTALDAENDEIGTTPRDISHGNTTALAASLVIKASAGKAFEIRGHNDSGSAQYIQVHDAASLPANGAVPEEVFTVPADSNFAITFPQGKQFSTGIVVCNSSTLATKTIGSADCWFSADFE